MNQLADKIFLTIETTMDKSVHLAEKGMDAFAFGSKKILDSTHALNEWLYAFIHHHYKKNNHIKYIKYASLPWSLAIPVGYKYLTRHTYQRLPIFQQGIHMVRAKVGGGKSLTSFVLAQMTLEETGIPSYFTSPVEKPQLSEDGKYYYVYHRVIDLKDYYKDGKKVMNYNTDKYKNIHKDERHLQYNPRMNKGKKYNESFIPEHEDHLLMRHDGMHGIYMYSQHMKLDSQDMDSLTFMHEVETVKDIPLKTWLDHDNLKLVPVKLKFTTHTIQTEFDGTMKRKKYAQFSLPVKYSVLQRYNTFAENRKHAGLKKDYE